MNDRIRGRATSAPAREHPQLALADLPAADADRVRLILDDAARRLNAIHPDTAMSSDALFTQVQIAVWAHHGVYNGPEVGRDITATLAVVRDLPLDGTRDEYAARLRLALHAVRL